jgi:hypothetical protein
MLSSRAVVSKSGRIQPNWNNNWYSTGWTRFSGGRSSSSRRRCHWSILPLEFIIFSPAINISKTLQLCLTVFHLAHLTQHLIKSCYEFGAKARMVNGWFHLHGLSYVHIIILDDCFELSEFRILIDQQRMDSEKVELLESVGVGIVPLSDSDLLLNPVTCLRCSHSVIQLQTTIIYWSWRIQMKKDYTKMVNKREEGKQRY